MIWRSGVWRSGVSGSAHITYRPAICRQGASEHLWPRGSSGGSVFAFMWQSALSSRFAGFMSRCRSPAECMNLSALSVCETRHMAA